MQVKRVNLETVCGITSRIPAGTLPEFAFAGKSNVGKSSLINGLMNRKSYARTSQQPGKTQTVNYYRINDDCFFVDLPGYGYAKVSKEMQQAWKGLMDRYFRHSGQLRNVFLLIDIRRDISDNDRMMAEWIRANGFPLSVIATKLDKIKRSQVSKQLAGIRRGLSLSEEEKVFPYSAITKQGRDEILDYLDELLRAEEDDVR